MSAWFQYQVKAEPVSFEGDPAINLDHWEPQYPDQIDPPISLAAWQQQWLALNSDPLPNAPAPELSWEPRYPGIIDLSQLLGAAYQPHFAGNDYVESVDMSWQQVFPDRLDPQRRLGDYPFWFGPTDFSDFAEPPVVVEPTLFRNLGAHYTADVLEQSSAAYFGVLTNEYGAVVAPEVLLSLWLHLYVERADGETEIIRSESVLNTNGVRVTDLQVRPTGQRYNLKWAITPDDTTLIDTSLPFERHIALFTWTWVRSDSSTGVGRREIVLNVQNLGEV
jgi:hypothetical protein